MGQEFDRVVGTILIAKCGHRALAYLRTTEKIIAIAKPPCQRHRFARLVFEQQNKSPIPFGAEPWTSDSTMVALQAHGSAYAAQGFPRGFSPNVTLLCPWRRATLHPSTSVRFACGSHPTHWAGTWAMGPTFLVACPV